jgi:hypothetical protein
VFGAFTSLGHNLIGDAGGTTELADGVNGDRAGTAANPLDARLGPLANNGGPTLTHALLAAASPSTEASMPAPPPGTSAAFPGPATATATAVWSSISGRSSDSRPGRLL